MAEETESRESQIQEETISSFTEDLKSKVQATKENGVDEKQSKGI